MTYPLHEQAKVIIEKAMKRSKSRGEVAATYGLPPDLVDCYLRGKDCGTLRAREVIRVEIARQRAEKEGRCRFRPQDKDKYKGTRGL